MLAPMELRTSEIESLIASNELNLATKRVMDFVTDFASNRKWKREAIDIRARYNALREEMRRFGKFSEDNEEFSRLRYGILEFIENLKDEKPVAQSPEVIELEKESDLPLSKEPKTKSLPKTKYELAREEFSKRRSQISVAQPTNIVFHGKDIKKKYAGKSINFTFQLPELQLKLGEITSVVGENGNGKTTLLRIIAGHLQITEGTLEYPHLVSDQKNDLYSIKQQIAFIPQELPKWSGYLADNLHFSASIHGINGDKNEEEVAFIMSRLGLDQYRNAKWSEISGGYRMRFALAKELVWNPKLIILDEPLANLDINAQQLFLQDIRYLADSIANPKSVIISSQHLYSMEGITDNIIFIADGTAIYNGKLKDFGNDRPNNSYEIACNLSKEAMADMLEGVSWNQIDETGNYFIINTAVNVTVNDLLAPFIKHKVEVSYFRDISKSTRRLFKLEK